MMCRIGGRYLCALHVWGSIAIALPALSSAQQTATVAGRVVHATTGAGIGEATIFVAPGSGARPARGTSDSAGRFRFGGLTAGRISVLVRRLGFSPESLGIELRAAQETLITVALRPSVQKLDTVTVAGLEDVLVRGKLSGFYERKRFGIGRFLEEADLAHLQGRRMSDVLVTRVPGIRAVRVGSTTAIVTPRLAPRALEGALSGRGPSPRFTMCFPDIYLDGAIVYVSGAGDALDTARVFDINTIGVAEVTAIEFYAGPAQMPAQFNKTGAACGALLVWTK